jgi:excisionase family DNA binding protein
MTHTHTDSPSPTEPIPFTGRPINGSLLLKVSEAAAALRISRSSLYRLFESGELAWVQIGASRRVTSAEIHHFIAAHTEAAS